MRRWNQRAVLGFPSVISGMRNFVGRVTRAGMVSAVVKNPFVDISRFKAGAIINCFSRAG